MSSGKRQNCFQSISPSSKDKKMVKSLPKHVKKKTKVTKYASCSKFFVNPLLNGQILKDTGKKADEISPIVKVKRLKLKNLCPDSSQRFSCVMNGSSESINMKENGINEKKIEVEDLKAPLSIRERLKRYVYRKDTTEKKNNSCIVVTERNEKLKKKEISKKNVNGIIKRKRPINSNYNSGLKVGTFTNSDCINSFHQKELNVMSDQSKSKKDEPDFLILNQGIPDKNSLSSLLFEINKIENSMTRDNTDFLSDILKMKPVAHFLDDIECDSDASVILDASMVHAASKYFEYQRTKDDVLSSNLCVDGGKRENKYAIINKVESCEFKFNVEREILIDDIDLSEVNKLAVLPDSMLDSETVPEITLDIENQNNKNDFNVISNDKCTENYFSEHQNEIYKEASVVNVDNNCQTGKCTENYFSEHQNEIHKDASVFSVDNNSQSDMEKTEDKNLLPEQSPLITFKSNSHSRGLYEMDILDDDVLDYEPSELSEGEISEVECVAAGNHKGESIEDLEFVKPAVENKINNADVNGELYSKENSKIALRNKQPTSNVEDEIYSEISDEDNYFETFSNDEMFSDCSNPGEYVEPFYDELTNERDYRNFDGKNDLPSNNDLIYQNCTNSYPESISKFQQESLFAYDCNHSNTSDSFLSPIFTDEFNLQQSNSNKSFDSSVNSELNVCSKESKSSNLSMCEINPCFNKQSSYTFINNENNKKMLIHPRKRNIQSIDDTDNDSEHSLKRRNCNVVEEHIQEQRCIDNSNQSDISFDLGDPKKVMFRIRELCIIGKIEEAINVAKKYIPISAERIQKILFHELFFSVTNYIRNFNSSLDESFCLEAIKNCMEIFYYYKLYESTLCSSMIVECLYCNLTTPNGSQILSFCQKNEIPIDSEAMESYVNIMKPTEMSVNDIISFLEYVTKVCKLLAPRFLLHEVLERFMKGKESSFSAGFFLTCKFLYFVSPDEIDKTYLKKFIEFCIKNDFWKEIADFLLEWTKKNFALTSLFEALAFQFERVGLFFEKLAEEMFGRKNGLSDHVTIILAQIGVTLMLEAFSKQLYENAFEILSTLHKHKVDFLALQKPIYVADTRVKAVSEHSDFFVFNFAVAFVALDICIYLNKLKDAYQVLDKTLTRMTGNFDKLNAKVRNRILYYLLTLTLKLHSMDPFGLGAEMLQNLVLVSGIEYPVEELSEYIKDIQSVFNKYLISFMNGHQDEFLKKFYSYTYGKRKDIFVLENQIIRAFIIFLVKNDLMSEAEKCFLLGYSRNIYVAGKQILESCPRTIIVSSLWTSEEIKFVFLKFVEDLTPILKCKPPKTAFNKWFAIKIIVKVAKDKYDIDFLNDIASDFKSAKARICNVLIDLDPNMKWEKVGFKSLLIIPETFYNFWILISQKFSSEPNTTKRDKNFAIPGVVRVSFGDEATETEPISEDDELNISDFTVDEHGSEMSCSGSSEESISEQNEAVDVQQLSPLQGSLSNIKHNTHPKTIFSNISQIISPNKISNCADQMMFSRTFLNDPNLVSPPPKTKLKGNDEVISPSNNHSQMNCVRNAFCSFSQSSPKKLIANNIEKGSSVNSVVNNTNNTSPKRQISRLFEKSHQNHEGNKLPDPAELKNITITINTSPAQTLDPSNGPPVLKLGLQPEAISPIKNVKLSTLKSIPKIRHQPVNSMPVGNENLSTLKPISLMRIQPKTSTPVSNNKFSIVKPISEGRLLPQVIAPNIAQPTLKPNIPESEFLKITNFLKSKVILKRKDMSPTQQQETALDLAYTFIQNNVVSNLDKKTMKLLSEFADKLVS
ncbi:uncharacterized protein NPIL_666781 [Nephila pilipes]|uniref:Uncharacterized protein n=1 Tax=Nephila pilipes TaxID=299642 RepID=A0A8X6U040_NEPPI|nr:uncharacterized protein NPIL_666781 [Nephila pilipes]